MEREKERADILAAQRSFYGGGHTRETRARIAKLRELRDAIAGRSGEIEQALRADLGKSPYEGYMTEVSVVLHELKAQIGHLERWARTKRVGTPLFLWPSASRIVREPYGHALVISPWNYPFQLLMAPLADAVAAGNVVAVKPSHKTPRTAELMSEIIAGVFEPGWVSCFVGETAVSTWLLEQRFDYIFFTGSPRVGRIVMEAAARNLTPVTLELGGKSPCIVDKNAVIDVAARRIALGKFINAGQTCIAPDYLLVHSDIARELLGRLALVIKDFYGNYPLESPDYPRIISEEATRRLASLLEGQNVFSGGDYDVEQRYFGPTIVTDPDPQSLLMSQEIFGPILPVIAVANMAEAVRFVNSREKPLALYYFGKRADGRRIIASTTSGGACINDTLLHVANERLPFGGVGNSGMGSYHGRAGFDTFTHERSVLVSRNWADFPVKYPPFRNIKLLKKLM